MTIDSTLPPRDRILQAAASLLAEHGRDGVSTRSVSALAGVQPQTIYRQYGDMRGLLNAVAKSGFASYLKAKSSQGSSGNPVADFRHGWDMHVEFALGNPALYALMYGDPRPGLESATSDIEAALGGVLHRVALAGALKIGVAKATQQVLAANVGVALALLTAQSRGEIVGTGSALSVDMREMLVGWLMDEGDTLPKAGSADNGASTAAVSAAALGASLPSVKSRFSAGELSLLAELLDRIGTDILPR
jgi:AcrR family transcriptional regulator